MRINGSLACSKIFGSALEDVRGPHGGLVARLRARSITTSAARRPSRKVMALLTDGRIAIPRPYGSIGCSRIFGRR